MDRAMRPSKPARSRASDGVGVARQVARALLRFFVALTGAWGWTKAAAADLLRPYILAVGIKFRARH
jgi:hypothetical protein